MSGTKRLKPGSPQQGLTTLGSFFDFLFFFFLDFSNPEALSKLALSTAADVSAITLEIT
jgi:hypothetical protein